jgi:ParB-like chromosome segregation protein Spo0J
MTEAAAAVYVDPKTLTPWDKNPRNNAEAIKQVAKSIERFGFASPIVARQADGRIIAGHTRHAAALKLGLEDVPVRFLDIDEQKASALALADNKIGEIATWNDDTLGEILAELEQDGFDLDGLGWDKDGLDKLLKDAEPLDEIDLSMDEGLIYSVVVKCADDVDQSKIMARLEEEGYSCQPLIS